jgi:hypothetical protein
VDDDKDRRPPPLAYATPQREASFRPVVVFLVVAAIVMLACAFVLNWAFNGGF